MILKEIFLNIILFILFLGSKPEMEGHMGSNHTQEINKYFFFTKVFRQFYNTNSNLRNRRHSYVLKKAFHKSIILNNNLKLKITQKQSFKILKKMSLPFQIWLPMINKDLIHFLHFIIFLLKYSVFLLSTFIMWIFKDNL